MKLTIVHEQKCSEKVFRESQCTLSKSQRFIHRLKRGCQTSSVWSQVCLIIKGILKEAIPLQCTCTF